jgi:23S rRNA (guanosine2251-2'-O)-methyltransferase
MKNNRNHEDKSEVRGNREDKKRDFTGRRDRENKKGDFTRRDNSEKIMEENENVVEGRNPVIEVLKSNRTLEKLYVAKGNVEGSIKVILSMAKEKGYVISEVDKRKLDEMSTTGSHQGVIAIVSPYTYSSIDEILEYAKQKGEDPFIIILDEIEDPHNLGSIVRSANVCGAHGVIIPKRRSALVTATVIKSSAGAVEHTKIAKITNINQTIEELKKKGVWVAGTDMNGEVCYKANLKGPMAIVIGSEGKGISKLVRENCDLIISIPMKGEINSLNASVAAGIVMYEGMRQRESAK